MKELSRIQYSYRSSIEIKVEFLAIAPIILLEYVFILLKSSPYLRREELRLRL